MGWNRGPFPRGNGPFRVKAHHHHARVRHSGPAESKLCKLACLIRSVGGRLTLYRRVEFSIWPSTFPPRLFPITRERTTRLHGGKRRKKVARLLFGPRSPFESISCSLHHLHDNRIVVRYCHRRRDGYAFSKGFLPSLPPPPYYACFVRAFIVYDPRPPSLSSISIPSCAHILHPVMLSTRQLESPN